MIREVKKEQVNPERLKLFTAALRSGEFAQDIGRLRGQEGYCCLGVAVEVAIANGLQGVVWDEGRKGYKYLEFPEDGFAYENAMLPPLVRSWYGFGSENPMLDVGERDGVTHGGLVAHGRTNTTTCNDELKMPFDKIADLFDATYGPRDEDESD